MGMPLRAGRRTCFPTVGRGVGSQPALSGDSQQLSAHAQRHGPHECTDWTGLSRLLPVDTVWMARPPKTPPRISA
jgi:hypothetical protein